jgi:hypothetical protein
MSCKKRCFQQRKFDNLHIKYYIDGVKGRRNHSAGEEARLLKIGEGLFKTMFFYRSFYFLLSSIAALLVIMFYIET